MDRLAPDQGGEEHEAECDSELCRCRPLGVAIVTLALVDSIAQNHGAAASWPGIRPQKC